MKISSMRPPVFLTIALAILSLAASVNLQAAPAPDAAQAPPADAPTIEFLNHQPVGETFKLAWQVLRPANQNYFNRLGWARQEMRAAALLLGVDLPGEPTKGHEDQTKSNARLELAGRMLQQLAPRLSGENQKAALGHLEKAVEHLNKAQKMRAVADEPSPTTR